VKAKRDQGCLLDKIDFNSKAAKGKKKIIHHIVKMGSTHQKNTTIINIYASDIREAKYIKQILTDLNEGRDNNTI